MKPIPKNLLIHSGTIQGVTSVDDWGVETVSEPIELTNVRFEPTSKVVRKKNNEEVQTTSVMFYDCVNSLPKGQSFTEDTIIKFTNGEYRVVAVDTLYDNSKLHHYEVLLS